MERTRQAFTALRMLVAVMLLTHGTFRALTGGVAGFGEFLGISGFPAGVAIAWLITVGEITGSILLALGLFIRPIALWFVCELIMGIILVHSPEGWFVVGGGRNGMEYSVVLIGMLLAQAWAAKGWGR